MGNSRRSNARRIWPLIVFALLGGLWGLAHLANQRAPGRTFAPQSRSDAPGRDAAAELRVPHLPATTAEGEPVLERAPLAPLPDRRAPLDSHAPDSLGEQEAVLQVRVLSLHGREPLAGVPLRLETLDGGPIPGLRPFGPRHGPGSRPCTDAEGRFDAAVPAGRELVLHASFERLAIGPRARRLVPAVAPGQYRTVVIELVDEPDLEWRGFIIDAETLEPVPGAQVLLVGSRGASALLATRSDSNGGVHLALDSDGRLDIVVACPGFAPRRHRIGPGYGPPSAPEEIALFRPAQLDLTVRAADGAPAAGLQVRLDAVGGWSGDVPARMGAPLTVAAGGDRTATTDEHGRARLLGLLPMVSHDLVLMSGGKRVLQQRVASLSPHERRHLDIDLSPPGSISGTVLDQHGVPVPEFTFALVQGGTDEESQPTVLSRVTTDEAGGFRFTDVSSGMYRLLSMAHVGARSRVQSGPFRYGDWTKEAVFAPRDIVLLAGESLEGIVIDAWRGLAIRGRVQVVGSSGSFSGRVFASLDDHQLVTGIDAQGAFVLAPLMPGKYALRLSTHEEGWRMPSSHAEAGTDGVVLEVQAPR